MDNDPSKQDPTDNRGEGSSGRGTKARPPAAQSTTTRLLRRGWQAFRATVRESADYRALVRSPYGLRPLLVLIGVGVFTSFDGAIFSTATPEIVQDLGLDLSLLGQANQVVGFFGIFLGLGIAYYADRHSRVPMVAVGTAAGGVFSFLTAGSQTLVPLVISRAGDGLVGGIAAAPIGALFADYYPPFQRGKAFALSGVLGNITTFFTPLAVLWLVENLGWQYAYLFSGPLMFVAAFLVFFGLKEPIRGYMERREQGLTEAEARIPEESVSFGEAMRTIWSIRSIRRLFLASIPAGVGGGLFGFGFSAFLFQDYGLGLAERTYLFMGLGLVSLPFGFLAGGLVDTLTRRRPERVLIFSGILGIVSSFFLFLIAAKLPLPVLVASFILFGAANVLLGPAGAVIFFNILPSHVRVLGGAVFGLAAVPAVITQFFLLPQLLERGGLQGLMYGGVPFIILGSIIALSAAPIYPRDLRSTFSSEVASADWRRAKEAGEGKLLVCRDVDVEYDGVQVLFGVDFDVDEGEIIALLGTNGAGKSTLLRAISGTTESASGAVVFDGRDTTHMPPHEIARRGVIHMPGGRGVFPGLTVKENLTLGNWMSESAVEAKRRLEEVYQIFPILKTRGNEKATLLSGGEQQMLSLAQAFMSKPKLLMIDELSLGLSPAVVEQLIKIVRAIHKQGTTIIVVEQSVNVALTIAERAIFMEKGEVKFVGETKDLLLRPDILRAVYVKGTGALTDKAPTSALMSEKEREYQLQKARPILQIQGVTKIFGGVTAVEDVSFELKEGEALGLIGPNGAGKTTLFDLICGFQIPDRGKIILEGKDIGHLRPDERAKLRLVRRFQDARLFPALTVFENLLVALDSKLDVRNVAFSALQLPQARQAEKRVRLRAERLIELLELGAYRDKFVRELSTGLRRITDLACVLATEPKVLMLDEPSTGIAQAESEALGPLLRRVRFETGCAMLIIEHDMPLISVLSDELIAMDQGKVMMRGTPEVVLNDEKVIQSYLGSSEDIVGRSGVRKSE